MMMIREEEAEEEVQVVERPTSPHTFPQPLYPPHRLRTLVHINRHFKVLCKSTFMFLEVVDGAVAGVVVAARATAVLPAYRHLLAGAAAAANLHLVGATVAVVGEEEAVVGTNLVRLM